MTSVSLLLNRIFTLLSGRISSLHSSPCSHEREPLQMTLHSKLLVTILGFNELLR